MAPFAKEKHAAWVRDKKIKNLRAARTHASAELSDDAEQADADGQFPTVVLVQESAIGSPHESRAALIRRREQQCFQALQIVDDWVYETRVCFALDQWLAFTDDSIATERALAAIRIQGVVRTRQGKKFMDTLRLAREQSEWEEKRKNHSRFRYLTTDEDKANGYTTNGKLYFATLHECEVFANFWQEMARRVLDALQRRIVKYKTLAWTKWTGMVKELVALERMPVCHLDAAYEMMRADEARAAEARADAGAGEDDGSAEPPWHPAVGFAGLPPLPRMWSHRDEFGRIEVEHPTKFNSFRAAMAGPSDTSNWMVPGHILVGAYPEGKAKRKGRQPVYTSTASQIMLTGIGTFVCAMTQSELDEFEAYHGKLPPLQEHLRKEHERIRGALAGSVVKMETALHIAKSEAKAVPRYNANDMRYAEGKALLHEAVARERMAFAAVERAKVALTHFPKRADLLYFPLADGDVPSMEDLKSVVTTLEARMQAGHKIYIFSRLGHGRAPMLGACLLGRLYGCRVHEALERCQVRSGR